MTAAQTDAQTAAQPPAQPPREVSSSPTRVPAAPPVLDFQAADEQASHLGDRYRGAGVLMLVLGALIVLCAVAPHALASEHAAAHLWGLAEVLLMLCVLGLALWMRQADLRRRWIDSRQTAEALRYAALAAHIEAALGRPEAAASEAQARSLSAELARVLADQVAYNAARHARYEQIEQGGGRIGVAVFAVALASALAHLVVHWPWLLFFTAVGPTLAGAIHGINGFLRLSDMADDHAETARALGALQQELLALAPGRLALDRLLPLAQGAHRVLTKREAQWRHVAQSVEPKLG